MKIMKIMNETMMTEMMIGHYTYLFMMIGHYIYLFMMIGHYTYLFMMIGHYIYLLMMIGHYIYLLMHHLVTLFTPRGSSSPYSKLPASSSSSIGHHPD
jgi:hypothetical protein